MLLLVGAGGGHAHADGAASASADAGISHTVAHTTMDLLANRVHDVAPIAA